MLKEEKGSNFEKYSDLAIPGTVHLVDLEGILNVKKDKHSHSFHNIILQPQPSCNPNDPLRWSKSKKQQQFWLLWVWAFLLAVAVNWTGPIWTDWTVEFNCTFTELNISSAICFLFLGLGCVFLQPTAMKLGRRFVYLTCTIIVIVGNIIGSQAISVEYLYVSNLLAGFAAAPVDSLVEISTTDVFFQHERAEYLSWFVFALYAGSDLGPVACGFIIQTMSWRWCFYFQIIFFAVLLVVQLFFMEDTTFERSKDVLKNFESLNVDEGITSTEIGEMEPYRNKNEKHKNKNNTNEIENISISDISSSDSFVPIRTYWQRMRLIELEFSDSRSWFELFYKPFLLITFPSVVWGGLIYGSQMMWLSLLATTQSEIYATSPYNFSSAIVGLTNIGALIGSLIGMIYGGKFVDYCTIKLTSQNEGIFEPEFRLWTMIVPTIFNAAGLLAYGLGTAYKSNWTVSVIIGQGLLGFAMSSSGSICLTYVVDAYPKIASEALVLMLFIRNCIGCSFTFAIQPWLDQCGLKLTTWLMFMLSILINGSFVIMLKWGKTFRRATTKRYYEYCGSSSILERALPSNNNVDAINK
ncbi:uncharacterized protein AC631_04959 [Debaryomyces fabryi]|uniref:Major facilitator superfamily (MFS) profile domain-containing protein n=1 Tax=Debaryomyces fabryi TaxID=58627 RepID=A0A0V1PST0_9ASCO|nr:uncharacterized protein AC631_04959 [Debaryomyces fabryi]KRZ99288.1 hypothetical protein AC631_04959 [Debaryomyces fabryi]CUM50704.1 unnamed protein product [Debaryomyces fabryi]